MGVCSFRSDDDDDGDGDVDSDDNNRSDNGLLQQSDHLLSPWPPNRWMRPLLPMTRNLPRGRRKSMIEVRTR